MSILAAISLGERLAGSGGILLVLVFRILPGLFLALGLASCGEANKRPPAEQPAPSASAASRAHPLD